LAGTITGEQFEQMGFENFVGDDFFTWMSGPGLFEQARGVVHALATRLTAAYDLDAVHEDLLKELYQELVDPETRHDLGEFYTPDWLAELTLREAGFPAGGPEESSPPSLFDPACGSGTFLFTAVRLLREAGRRGTALVDFCAEHLAGIDVHPLAVTIAKTNLLLALGDDLRKHRKHFVLPVHMADSLSPGKLTVKPDPEKDAIRISVDCERISIRAGKPTPSNLYPVFELPAALASQPETLHESLNALLDFAGPETSEADALQGLRRRLDDLGVPAAHWHYWANNVRLMRWLLEAPATDTVWRFILKNACQPELLARRKFAFVVGNPPWLAYFQIKRRDYQERVRALASAYELVGKRHLGLIGRTELATLFFALSVDRYLADGGTLAFVMPRSVLTGAKQHARFRRHYVAAARSLIDCERTAPLFNVPACVVTWKKTAETGQVSAGSESIQVLCLQGALPNRNSSLSQVRKHLTQVRTTYTPPLSEEASAYWEQLIQGADIIPRCLWFVRPPLTATIVDRRRPHLETDPTIERHAKAPWKGLRLSGRAEAEFLFATLLSSNLLPFGWRQFSLVLLPLAVRSRGKPEVLNVQDAVRQGKAGLADWLRKAEAIWRENAKVSELVRTVYERLNYLNKLTSQQPGGVVRLLYNAAGSHVCACVVSPSDPRKAIQGLSVRGFIADQTTYWLETTSGDEPDYLCAILNAPSVDEAIKPYQTKGLFGAQRGKGERHVHRRPFEVLPIPRFEKSDRRHRKLAELSRHCHEKVRQAVADAGERWVTVPIGRLRTEIRAELLADELAQINEIVGEVLKRS
jgi:hypothetical protein